MKVIVRPVLVRGQKHIQFSYFDAKKDITKNYLGDEIAEKLAQILALEFKNVHVQMAHNIIDILITNKGQARVHNVTSPVPPMEANLSHDRQKKVLLAADAASPFLKALGINTQDGKITPDMQSKVRQINEILKLVQANSVMQKYNT